MQKFAVNTAELWKIPEEQAAPAGAEVAMYLSAEVDGRIAELQQAYAPVKAWGMVETQLLLDTFRAADAKHGHTETLFAVVNAYLRHVAASLNEVHPK